jgi:hypothetical protein
MLIVYSLLANFVAVAGISYFGFKGKKLLIVTVWILIIFGIGYLLGLEAIEISQKMKGP